MNVTLDNATHINWTSAPPTDMTDQPKDDVNQAEDAIWILTSTFIIFTMQSGGF